MSEAFYTSKSRVVKVDGVHRRAFLHDDTPLEFGLHGPIKLHYGMESQPNLPLPVDYLVASAAG